MTEDGKFEVGDMVRCIEEPSIGSYQIEIGTVFKIDYVNRNIISPDRHAETCYRTELFELVQSFGSHRLLKRGGMYAGQPDL